VSDERRVAVWRDGAAVDVPADQPVVTAFDQGLGRGDGVFESVAVVGARTPHLDPHLARISR
jgi:4-amino-4-deoxychorismate lyase